MAFIVRVHNNSFIKRFFVNIVASLNGQMSRAFLPAVCSQRKRPLAPPVVRISALQSNQQHLCRGLGLVGAQKKAVGQQEPCIYEPVVRVYSL